MVELIFKLVLTFIMIVVVLTAMVTIRWTWSRQIDVKGTILGVLRNKTEKPLDWVATRDPNAIFQNNNIVGNITGEVKESDGKIIFTEICDTFNFEIDAPFEYKRDKLKVIKVGVRIGSLSSTTNQGTRIKNNVMRNVVCERIK